MGKFCAKCGNPLNENEKFCGSCGAPNEDFQSAPQQTVQTATQVQSQQAPVSQEVPPYDPQQAAANFAQEAPRQTGPNPAVVWAKGHKSILVIAAAALVVVIAAIVILSQIFKYQVLDPKDFVTVEFAGANGVGYADATFNSKDIMETHYSALASKNKTAFDYDFIQEIEKRKKSEFSDYFSEDKEDLLKAWSKASNKKEAKKFIDALTDEKSSKKDDDDDDDDSSSVDSYRMKFKLDKSEGLSNGDTVKVTIDCDEDYLKEHKIKLKSTEFEVEVKGLEKDVEELDFFKDYNVTFDGNDGSGYAKIDYDNKYYFVDYSYDYNQTSSYNGTLSNGDKFTVTAKISTTTKKSGDKSWFKYDGKYYIVANAEEEKEFEVSGLKELEAIDPFEDIKFETRHAAPYLYIYGVESDSVNENIKDHVSYSIDNYEDLKNGDKFTVKVYAYSSLADAGYKLTGDRDDDGYYTKEYTVDDSYPTYVDSSNAAAAEKALGTIISDQLAKQKKKDYASFNVGKSGYRSYKSLKSVEYVESYIRTKKEDSSSYSAHYAQIVSIYKFTVKNSDGKAEVYYYAVGVNDPYKIGDTYKTESDSTYSKYSEYESATIKDMEAAMTKDDNEDTAYTAVKYNKNKASAAKKAS